MDAGGGWGSAGEEDEVVPPEEHLHRAQDWPASLQGGRPITSLVGHKTTQIKNTDT